MDEIDEMVTEMEDILTSLSSGDLFLLVGTIVKYNPPIKGKKPLAWWRRNESAIRQILARRARRMFSIYLGEVKRDKEEI